MPSVYKNLDSKQMPFSRAESAGIIIQIQKGEKQRKGNRVVHLPGAFHSLPPFLPSMISSRRTKTISEALTRVLLHKSINQTQSQSYQTLHSNKPSRHGRTRKPPPPPKVRKSIPFVTNVKEVENPDEALSLFNEYQDLGFKHDYPSYSALIYKLARSHNFEKIETLLDYIKVNNIRCRETMFVALMKHYGKSNLSDKAIALFHQIPSFNCTRTLPTFNFLLDVLVENDRFCDAKQIFSRASKMGFRPNTVSFNIIIKGYIMKGDWENACKVFEEMLDREIQPTVVTYNSLIGYLCENGDLVKGMRLFQDMTRKGKYPNAVTYALLMKGYCSIGKYDDAKKMMFDMEYRGCKPRLLNFGVLMNDLGKRGKIDEAKGILGEMKKRRFKPDTVTYNIFINYLCGEGRAVEAYKFFVDMQVEGCEPNCITYRMMVDGFCRIGDFDGGLRVLTAMLVSKHFPRLETFCCLVVGLSEHGRLNDAFYVLEEMVKRKMTLNLEGWAALVKAACHEDRICSVLASELATMDSKLQQILEESLELLHHSESNLVSQQPLYLLEPLKREV